ncbi:GGDEF domain-containing protein [Thermincola ferriacetica]
MEQESIFRQGSASLLFSGSGTIPVIDRPKKELYYIDKLRKRKINMEKDLLDVIKSSINEILAGLYDSVRIIEVKTHDQYVLTPSGKIEKQDIFCHEFWDRDDPCKNCVARRSQKAKGIQEKVEVYHNKVYLVVGLPIADGEYIIEIVKDITELVTAREEIMFQCEVLRAQLEQVAQTAYVDALTGIWNRRYIEERFPGVLHKADSLGKKVAVFMVDIDHFKVVNDTYGHTNGDEVLRRVARILQRGIRGQDAAVRYGGEEFCVILYDVSEEVAVQIAERIREQISREEIIIEGRKVRVTVSIGVAFGEPGLSVEKLLATADRRLYRGKELGRNRVVWRDE